jgi:hypothetical protein
MNNVQRILIIAGLGAVLIGLGVAYWLNAADDETPRVAVPPSPQPTSLASESTRTKADAARPSLEPTRPATPERDTSDRMRAQIQRSLAARTDVPTRSLDFSRPPRPEPNQDGPIEASELSEHNQAYLRERVKSDLVPAVLDCYTSALAIDPKLAGKVALQFAVIGDPEIGGVVEYAEILEAESTLVSPFLSECVRESTLAMTFDAPPEGGRFELNYPIEFSADDE